MSLHSLFGTHQPDLKASRWDEGRFVTTCENCGRAMVKPPGGSWLLSKRR
jgi:hypothetical protein